MAMPQSMMSPHSIPEIIAGGGFYKLGYVTNDRERALETLEQQYGFTEFYRFEPDLEVTTADGHTGRAHLQCAFTVGQEIILEVMEPLDGSVEIFSSLLQGATDFRLEFHHLGVLVDDFASTHQQMVEAGFPAEWTCRQEEGINVSYHRLPLLGHMVEVVKYAPTTDLAWLRGMESH